MKKIFYGGSGLIVGILITGYVSIAIAQVKIDSEIQRPITKTDISTFEEIDQIKITEDRQNTLEIIKALNEIKREIKRLQ